jgi:hypothetical protein
MIKDAKSVNSVSGVVLDILEYAVPTAFIALNLNPM